MRVGEIWKYKEDNLSTQYWAKELTREIREILRENDEWANAVRVRISWFNDKKVCYVNIGADSNWKPVEEEMEYFLDAFEKDWEMN